MKSMYRPYWVSKPLKFPRFNGTRIMMMPVKLGSLDGVPENYHALLNELYGLVETRFIGQVGYLTIDEKEFLEDRTHRREGWHVDGFYHGKCGAWGGGGSWGSTGNGMIVVSNVAGCEAVLGDYPFKIDSEGGASYHCKEEMCEYEVDKAGISTSLFKAGIPYWVDGACVHRSIKQRAGTKRQFLRLSMPNNGAWFKGYTENTAGIKPTGEILPKRTQFMSE